MAVPPPQKDEAAVNDQHAHMVFPVPPNAAEDDLIKIDKFRMHARRHVAAYVRLEVEPTSEAIMTKTIVESAVGPLRGARISDEQGNSINKTFVHLTYDVKLAGKASSAPHLRVPPLRQNGGHLAKCIGAALKSRADPETIDPGDLFLLYDGMKHGNENVLTQTPFKTLQGHALTRTVRRLVCMYSEGSLRARLGTTRRQSAIRQVEHIYLISAQGMRVVPKDHLHYDGTNQGETIGFVHATKWTDPTGLRVTAEESKALFGKVGLIAVGDANPSTEEKPLSADGKEPAFYHAPPYELDAEMCHSWPAAAHIDFTPGPGHRALLSCKKKLPYLGFCLTETHRDLIIKHLEGEVFKAMQVEGGDLYQPALAELLVDKNDKKETEDDAEEKEDDTDDKGDDDAEEEPEKAGEAKDSGKAQPTTGGVKEKKGKTKETEKTIKKGKAKAPATKSSSSSSNSKQELLKKLNKLMSKPNPGNEDNQESCDSPAD